jgi:tubulin-like protein CetZ
MKLVAIGIGQCGSNIADEFYGVNNYAKSFFGRRLEILTDAFAVNTDDTDLSSLKHIPRDMSHRIVIGTTRTSGHGVGKVNIEGASIMKENLSIIIDDVLNSRDFYSCDAVMVIASGAGGTGSGGIGPLVKGIKERVEKPVYAIVVLPFGYEEFSETSFAVVNTATCLKTVDQYADAVFVLDNERFGRGGVSLARNLETMNQQMVKNFFDLFCAGEEGRNKFVGSTVVDAGDIKQSLSGISTIGRGEVALPLFHRWKRSHYKESTKGMVNLAGAMNQAINNLCLKADTGDAGTILALLCAPDDIISLNAVTEISNNLQQRAPKSEIRIADYPRRTREVSITLVLSTLPSVDRTEKLFIKATELLSKQKALSEERYAKMKRAEEIRANIPTLD